MPDKAELAHAIARVDADIIELRTRLGAQKDTLIKEGKRATWNARRAALTKPLYNLLERRWALNLLKHAASSEALYNVKVIGMLLPEAIQGTIVPPATRLLSTDVTTPRGPMPKRTYDVMQFEPGNPDFQPHELKSDAGKSKKGVLASSVEGGLTHPDIEVHLRQKSTPAKQIAAEKELIREASKIPGTKIVVEGTDAVTGAVVRKHIDPQGLNLSRFSNYSDLPDVLTLRKPDPADMAPAPPQKPARKKKAKAQVKKPPSASAKRPRKKPAPATPAGDLAEAAKKQAKPRRKKPAKAKVDPALAASRGITPPSPNAPTEGANKATSTPPARKPAAKRKAAPPKPAVNAPASASRAVTPPSPTAAMVEAAETSATVPSRAAPSAAAAGVPGTAPSAAPASARKGKFSLELKISPKIRAVGGLVLTIGFDLFLGWLESRRISRIIKVLIEENRDKFEVVVNADATQADFGKFRAGSNLEKGYQLYFQISLTVTRHCTDGGCGFSGSISDIFFKGVRLSRTKGSDFFPDPQKGKGWNVDATAVFYQPIFENGMPIRAATEDAADADLAEFHQTFVRRKRRGIGDATREYFDDFRQYATLFPQSAAGELYLGFALTDYLADITAVELGRKPPAALMEAPHNLAFDQVLNQVRWGLASRIAFIVDFYQLVIHLRPEYAIAYLERYDAYFREMDDGYRKCNVSCHRMTADKRIIQRLTADDIRRKYRWTGGHRELEKATPLEGK